MSLREPATRADRAEPVIQSSNRPLTTEAARCSTSSKSRSSRPRWRAGRRRRSSRPPSPGAGGLGFVAAGYRIARGARRAASPAPARSPTGRSAVNLFAPTGAPADPAVVARYAERPPRRGRPRRRRARRPRFDDDAFEAKLALLERPPVARRVVHLRLPAGRDGRAGAGDRRGGVGDRHRARRRPRRRSAAGADALVVQGSEAGGHRGAFVDRDDRVDYGLLALLQLVRRARRRAARRDRRDRHRPRASRRSSPRARRRPRSARRSCAAPRPGPPRRTAPRSPRTARPA